jgi:hypothetical protein
LTVAFVSRVYGPEPTGFRAVLLFVIVFGSPITPGDVDRAPSSEASGCLSLMTTVEASGASTVETEASDSWL